MKKLILVAIMLMIIATMFIFGDYSSNNSAPVSQDKQNEMVKLAQKRFTQKKSEGLDIKNGPCLGIIAIGWVTDVAHNPREASDDQPANQCEDYRNGFAKHFVELDLNGQLIQVK
jgi:hypothetical protein